jgi:hypothetical protein
VKQPRTFAALLGRRGFLRATVLGSLLWSGLCFAQNIFIDSPRDGNTVPGPTVKLRLTVSDDFVVGQDGRILILVDGAPVGELATLRSVLWLPPGTYEIQAELVDLRSRRIATSIPAQSKVTVSWSSEY